MLEDTVLMDPSFVREGVGANDGFVARHVHASRLGDGARGAGEFLGLNSRADVVIALARMERHDHFFK